MPEAAEKEADRELRRLQRIPASPEYSVAIDDITWLCDLPWDKDTKDQLNLNHAKKILDPATGALIINILRVSRRAQAERRWSGGRTHVSLDRPA